MKSVTKQIRQYQKLRVLAHEKGALREEAESLNYLGDLHTQIGEHDEALSIHKEELGLCQVSEDKIGQAVAHRKIGECYTELGNYSKALHHQCKHLELAKLADNVPEEQRAFTTIGRTYLIQGEDLHNRGSHDEAKAVLHEAVSAFRSSVLICEVLQERAALPMKEVRIMKVRSITNLAYAYHLISLASSEDINGEHAKQSLALYQKALVVSRKYMLCEETHRINLQLTMYYHVRSQIPDAVRHAEETVRHAKSAKNPLQVLEAFREIANVYLACGNCRSARRALKKSFRLSQSDENKKEIKEKLKEVLKILNLQSRANEAATSIEKRFKVLDKIADKFFELGCFQEALNNYKKQEEMFPCVGRITDKQKASVYYSLASTSLDLEDYDTALEYYKKEMECYTEPKELAETWSQVGLCLEKSGKDYTESESCYIKAVEYAEQTKDSKLQLKTLNLLLDSQDQHNSSLAAGTRSKISELQIKSGIFVEEDDDSEELCGKPTMEMVENEGDNSELEQEDDNHLVEKELETVSSDDSDAEENRKTVATIRAWKRKRNEKGETPLHVACISGQMKRVQLLLEQNHPVNAPDHAGWSPLHEACIHGHTDIVKLLLDNGANVNYMASCGTTPMQDAASNGYLDIITVLQERGADGGMKNNMGDTAMSNLELWFSRNQDNLDSYEIESYWTIHKSLGKLQKGGEKNDSDRNFTMTMDGSFDAELFTQDTAMGGLTSNPCPESPGHSLPRSGSLYGTQRLEDLKKNNDEFCPDLSRDALFDDRQILPTFDPKPCIPKPLSQVRGRESQLNVADEYRVAMESLGGSASLAKHFNSLKPTRAAKRPLDNRHGGLVDEDDYVGDDWLIDDLEDGDLNLSTVASGRHRKRPKVVRFLGTGLTGSLTSEWPKTNSVKKTLKEYNSGLFTSCLNGKNARNRSPSSDKLAAPKIKDLPRAETIIGGDDNIIIEDDHTQTASNVVNILTSASFPSSCFETKAQPPQQSTLRVKVKINGRMFLIAVPGSTKTIAWLCERASLVYKQNTGLRPKIALYSGGAANEEEEACLLSNDDLVSDVLQSNEHVAARIESWESAPLSQIYEEACNEAKQVVIPAVMSACHRSSTTGSIHLQNHGLLTRHLKPLVTNLTQPEIASLLLPGNCLGNDGIMSLCEALQNQLALDMPLNSRNHLVELNLRCANLTQLGLNRLAQAAESRTLKGLQTLDISYNRLGDFCGNDLVSILKHCSKALKNLNVSRCRFTEKLFQSGYQIFKSAMRDCVSLSCLDISHNSFGSVGLELLLRSLPHASLVSLDLSGLCDATDNSLMARHTLSFMKQEHCSLQTLRLSSNCLNGLQLAGFICELKCVADSHLRHLDISRNCLDLTAEIRLSSLLAEVNSIVYYSLKSGHHKWQKNEGRLQSKKEVTESDLGYELGTAQSIC